MAVEVEQALMAIGSLARGPFTPAELRDVVRDATVLMVRLGHYVDDALIRAAPRLRFIVTATTGLDHIDVDAARSSGVRVISLRDCPDEIRDVSATAELTWGLLLALVRSIPAAARHVTDGGWDRTQFWGMQLRGKRLGVIGQGRIGTMVSEYGAAFGMDVVAYDEVTSRVVPPARPLSLDELVRTSDVISVHVTADARNRHLMNGELLRIVKPGAILLNTSRGSLVDSQAIVDALGAGRLGGVAVDVLQGEEHRGGGNDPLVLRARTTRDVLVTPHIGGATRESITVAEGAVVAELGRAMAAEARR